MVLRSVFQVVRKISQNKEPVPTHLSCSVI